MNRKDRLQPDGAPVVGVKPAPPLAPPKGTPPWPVGRPPWPGTEADRLGTMAYLFAERCPHGWIRIQSYGSKWHRATKDLQPACGSAMRARGDVEHEDSPKLDKFHASHSVCVACFRAAIGLEPCCPKCGRMG